MNAPVRPKTKEECLQPQLLIAQDLGIRHRRFPGGEVLQISGDGPVVPTPSPAVEGMGGRAEAEIGAVVPILAVMAGLEAVPPREIGDFIVLIAGLFQDLSGPEEIPGLKVIVGEDNFSRLAELGEGGIRLHGELVTGEVFRMEGEGCPEGGEPDCKGISGRTGKAVDKVDAEIVEARVTAQSDRFQRLPGLMAAAKEGERLVIKGLATDVQAVRAGAPKRCEESCGDVAGVGLKGDLGIGRNRESGPDVVDQTFEISCGKDGRRSTADIHRIKLSMDTLVQAHFTAEHLKEIRDPSQVGDGVETAVRAFPDAERDMDVETRQGGHFTPYRT